MSRFFKNLTAFRVGAVVFFFGAATAFSQVPLPNVGVINGKALTLAKPSYPWSAAAVGAGGTVDVSVTVDTAGKVVFAKAVSGHALLRQTSEQAALASTFAPFIIKGVKSRVQGIIVYNFVSSAKSGAGSNDTAQSDKPADAPKTEKSIFDDDYDFSDILNNLFPKPTPISGHFTSKDAEIYYEIYGKEKSGTPIIFVHGGPGFDHQYFLSSSAITDLAENRPVVFYDQRGTGKSEKVSGAHSATLQNTIEDLENLRRHLGYEKIEVVGHSFGGLAAMTYAVFFPDKISHLVLIDSVSPNYDEDSSTFEEDFPKEFQEMNARRMEYLMGGRKDPKLLRASVVAYMKMLFHSPENRDRFVAGSEKFLYSIETNNSVNTSAEGFNITPGIAKLSIPTLILHGKYDSNIALETAEKIRKTIPDSRLIVFENSGHLPFYEEPQKFVKTVEDFLGQH